MFPVRTTTDIQTAVDIINSGVAKPGARAHTGLGPGINISINFFSDKLVNLTVNYVTLQRRSARLLTVDSIVSL